MGFATLSDPDWWNLDSHAPREPASTARIHWLAGLVYSLLSPRRKRQIRAFLNVPRDGDDPEWTETLRRIRAKLDAKT